MATKTEQKREEDKSAAAADQNDKDKSAVANQKRGQGGQGDTKTTQKQREDDESRSTEVEDAETNADAAATGGVAGAVVRQDTGLDADDNEDAAILDVKGDDVKGAVVGTVRAGKEDVPYVFLTPDLMGSKIRTSDTDDGDVRSWNAQTTEGEGDDAVPVALVPVQAEPGQTFTVEELPNVDVLRAAGIDPAQLLNGLPIRLGDPDVHIRPGGGSLG